MMQIISQTHEEKQVMYNKLSKKELIEMLIAANNVLQNMQPQIVYPVVQPWYLAPIEPYYLQTTTGDPYTIITTQN